MIQNYINRNLVGTWVNEDSVYDFYADGGLSIKWKKENKIRDGFFYTIENKLTMVYSTYDPEWKGKIISLTNDVLKIESQSDNVCEKVITLEKVIYEKVFVPKNFLISSFEEVSDLANSIFGYIMSSGDKYQFISGGFIIFQFMSLGFFLKVFIGKKKDAFDEGETGLSSVDYLQFGLYIFVISLLIHLWFKYKDKNKIDDL